MYKHYFTFENISIVLKLRLRSRLGSHLRVCVFQSLRKVMTFQTTYFSLSKNHYSFTGIDLVYHKILSVFIPNLFQKYF